MLDQTWDWLDAHLLVTLELERERYIWQLRIATASAIPGQEGNRARQELVEELQRPLDQPAVTDTLPPTLPVRRPALPTEADAAHASAPPAPD